MLGSASEQYHLILNLFASLFCSVPTGSTVILPFCKPVSALPLGSKESMKIDVFPPPVFAAYAPLDAVSVSVMKSQSYHGISLNYLTGMPKSSRPPVNAAPTESRYVVIVRRMSLLDIIIEGVPFTISNASSSFAMLNAVPVSVPAWTVLYVVFEISECKPLNPLFELVDP